MGRRLTETIVAMRHQSDVCIMNLVEARLGRAALCPNVLIFRPVDDDLDAITADKTDGVVLAQARLHHACGIDSLEKPNAEG